MCNMYNIIIYYYFIEILKNKLLILSEIWMKISILRLMSNEMIVNFLKYQWSFTEILIVLLSEKKILIL